MLRSGDLLKIRSGTKADWDPSECTHRGRSTSEKYVEEGGHHGKNRFKLELKPTKTGQEGPNGFVKTFIVDHETEALSAGAGLESTIAQDPVDRNIEKILLFRDSYSGAEITYNQSKRRLAEFLCTVGLDE